MIELKITANNFQDMRNKLLEAAEGIKVSDNSMQITNESDNSVNVFHKTEQERYDNIYQLPATLPTISPIDEEVPPLTIPTLIEEMKQEAGEKWVDSKGTVWDAKIHSSSRQLKADGTWRARRNVESSSKPTDIAVQASMREQVSPKAEVQPVTVINPAASEPAKSYENIPIPNTQKPAHDFASFKATLIPTLAGLVKDGKLTQEYIQSLKTYFKVNEIWQVNDEQLSVMFDEFANAGLVTKVG